MWESWDVGCWIWEMSQTYTQTHRGFLGCLVILSDLIIHSKFCCTQNVQSWADTIIWRLLDKDQNINRILPHRKVVLSWEGSGLVRRLGTEPDCLRLLDEESLPQAGLFACITCDWELIGGSWWLPLETRVCASRVIGWGTGQHDKLQHTHNINTTLSECWFKPENIARLIETDRPEANSTNCKIHTFDNPQ